MLNRGGDDLSQGQRQLITIARAFLADPNIPHPRWKQRLT